MPTFNKQFIITQSGAVLIELAIVIPLLLLLVIGIIELSFTFYHLNILNKSVEDGARYFSTPLMARNGNVGSLIDTRTSENKTHIDAAKNLIIYGNIDGTGSPLMPDAANYASISISCAEETFSSNVNKICDTTTHHIRVTAIYNHDLMVAPKNTNLDFLGFTLANPLSLTASTVMRVE
jgi:hypothetical protein